MCLVSYVPTDNGIIISSNRDEAIHRGEPTIVHKQIMNNKSLSFPKDIKGGTWIVHDDSDVIVLLNGAKERHERKDTYRMSRGLIVLDLMAQDNIMQAWMALDLTDIEPFTLVSYSSKFCLLELVWNGTEKISSSLDNDHAHFWLSSTLYTRQEIDALRPTFENTIGKHSTPEDIALFHSSCKYEDKTGGLVIPDIKTISFTQIVKKNSEIKMYYKSYNGLDVDAQA
jgi:hypothetical protein